MTGGAGTVVQRRDAAGLLFSNIVYEPGSVLGLHAHPNAYISFVGAGSYTERLSGLTRHCESSTLLFHAAGERHANVFHDEPVSLLRVEASDSQLLDIPQSAAWSKGFRGEQSRYLCRRMLRELHASDAVTPLALHGLALELVAELARASIADRSPEPAWLKRIDDVLHESFREPPSLAVMSACAGVHPVHLARTYRQHRHQTIGERVRELRLEEACRLLATTRDPIAAIAHCCGFADQSHLGRLMRRRLGVSPSEYRAQRSGR